VRRLRQLASLHAAQEHVHAKADMGGGGGFV
jgi:hypothetical protein